MLRTSFFSLFVFAVAALASAQALADPQPGDACTTANAYITSGGPENAGKAFTMTCQGGVWVRITESDTAGNLGVKQADPKAPLHVGGEAIIGPTTGLACDTGRTGGLRWSSANSTFEMCDGTSWRLLAAASVASDCTPNAFSFTDLTNQPLNTLTVSNSLNITGIDAGCVVSVTGGGAPQISVNGGVWTTSTVINPGDALRVRLTSSGSANTALVAAVVVGTSTDNWSVTTASGGTRIFHTSTTTYNGSFGGQAAADTACQSAAAGLGYGSYWRAVLSDNLVSAKDRLTITYPVVRASNGATVAASNLWAGSISNAVGSSGTVWTGTTSAGTSASEHCSGWTSLSGNGVCGTASATDSSWLNGGGGSCFGGTGSCSNAFMLYCIEQPDPGCSPNAFSFTNATNAALSSVVTSNSVTPTGCATAVTVKVLGQGTPQIRINGGAWGTTGTISPGESLEVRLTAASTYATARSARVYVGGIETTWSVTTLDHPPAYFVLTQTTWNGDLGGQSGAHAKCLTELTTNTNWMGYATANANGLLTASKVFAFGQCGTNGGACTGTMIPNMAYRFAVVGDSAKGGSTFVTDSSGRGPNDSANWAGTTYFGTSTSYWSSRHAGANKWTNTGWGAYCSNWTSSSSGVSGGVGIPGSTGDSRWHGEFNPNSTCDNLLPLVCFVNP